MEAILAALLNNIFYSSKQNSAINMHTLYTLSLVKGKVIAERYLK